MPQNGRTPPPEKLEPFTFPDTGRTVQIRKVSTLLRAETRRQVIASPGFEEPRPPMSEVDYGDGKIKIPNPAHPVYQQLLLDWTNKVNAEVYARIRQIVLKRGVVVTEKEIDQDAVTQVRSVSAETGTDLTAYDDRYVYVAFVCIGSEKDWTELIRAVYDRNAPQEAAIQAHIATFPADVSREEPVQSEP
jgi:hypothetical protein